MDTHKCIKNKIHSFIQTSLKKIIDKFKKKTKMTIGIHWLSLKIKYIEREEMSSETVLYDHSDLSEQKNYY
jgi:hypothetical protein